MALTAYYYQNDNLIELTGLAQASDDAYVNNAQVEVTLLDRSGDEVSGETWPLAMTYVSGSNGNYQGVMTDSVEVSEGEIYTAKVTAVADDGLSGTWNLTVKVMRRRHE